MPFSLTPRWVFQHYSEITPDWLWQQGITRCSATWTLALAAKKTRRPDCPRGTGSPPSAMRDRFHDRLQQPPGSRVTEFCADLGAPSPRGLRPPWHGLGRTGSAPPCWGQAADGYTGRQSGRACL
ncbi:MAG: hypothetical protein ACLTYN_11855 [Dysosmobacter welbionis]